MIQAEVLSEIKPILAGLLPSSPTTLVVSQSRPALTQNATGHRLCLGLEGFLCGLGTPGHNTTSVAPFPGTPRNHSKQGQCSMGFGERWKS